MLIINIVSGLLIFIGMVFTMAGAVGMLRMPDFYTRLHAASLTDTGGATFIILGLLLQDIFIFENVMAAIKLLLILLFIAFTAPTASHALAKMAIMGGLVPQCQNGKSVIAECVELEGVNTDSENVNKEEVK